MSEKGRRRKKTKKEEEVIEPKRRRAKKGKKKEEEVVEPLEEHMEEKGKKWYIISLDCLRVLYSPVKAFQRITEEPDIKGVLLILALTLLATTGSFYANFYHINFGLSVLENIAEQIPTIGPPYNITGGFINPSEPRLITICTFNWTSGSDTVTIYGKNATDHDINETVVITLDRTFYNTSKYFKTVTMVEFSHGGDGEIQYVILGVSPEEYIPGVASNLFIPSLIQGSGGLVLSALSFFVGWFIYAGVFWLVLRGFQEEIESVGALFITMGHVFIIAPHILFGVYFGVILNVVYMSFLFASPSISLPLRAWTGVNSELYNQIVQENWSTTWSYQALNIPWPWIFQAWAALLSMVAVRFLFKTTWRKAAIIAVVANFANFLIRTFII